MHHSESRRVWMQDDTDDEADAEISVEVDAAAEEPRPAGVTFEDVEQEVAAVRSDLEARIPRATPKHAILPPPLPQDQAQVMAPEDEPPSSTLTPPSTRDLSTVTTDATFSFPPPTIQSVAPVALDTISQGPAAPPRPKATYLVAATLLMGVLIVLMFSSWGAITAPNTKTWGANWKPPAPAAPAAAAIPEPAQPHSFSLDPVEVFAPATTPATTAAAQKAARTLTGQGKQYAAQRTMRTNARLALDDVLQPARMTCREDGMTPIAARVTATFGPDGRVMNVEVDVPAPASDVGGCLAVAARRARIDPFVGEPLQISRTVKVQ